MKKLLIVVVLFCLVAPAGAAKRVVISSLPEPVRAFAGRAADLFPLGLEPGARRFPWRVRRACHEQDFKQRPRAEHQVTGR